MNDSLLAERTGLPDALRYLVERYPREMWEAHPNFSDLTRFWLDRHLLFRDLQARLAAATEEFLSHRMAPPTYRDSLARMAGTLLTELHTHHSVEDRHYFPALAARDAGLAPAFALLDRDHHALEAEIQAMASAATAALQAPPDTLDAAQAFHDLNAAFGRLLDRHLTDEEEVVVPVILEYGESGPV